MCPRLSGKLQSVSRGDTGPVSRGEVFVEEQETQSPEAFVLTAVHVCVCLCVCEEVLRMLRNQRQGLPGGWEHLGRYGTMGGSFSLGIFFILLLNHENALAI